MFIGSITWENVRYGMCAEQRLRSACACAHSDQSLLFACWNLITLATRRVPSKMSDQTRICAVRSVFAGRSVDRKISKPFSDRQDRLTRQCRRVFAQRIWLGGTFSHIAVHIKIERFHCHGKLLSNRCHLLSALVIFPVFCALLVLQNPNTVLCI